MRLVFLSTFLIVLSNHNAFAAEVLPAEAFSKLPDVRDVNLSPDGKFIASLVSYRGDDSSGTAISIVSVETGKTSFPLSTNNEKFIFKSIQWASDHLLLASIRFPASYYGTPITETRLLKIDINTLESESVIRNSFLRRYERLPQFHDNIVDMIPDDPENIMLALAMYTSGRTSIYQFNLETGRSKNVSVQGGLANDWVTDRDHNVRIGIRFEDTTYEIVHRPLGSKKWATLWEFEAFSEDQVWPLGFDSNPNLLYVRAYHQDKEAIFKVHLLDEELDLELVFSDPKYDVDGRLIYSHHTGEVIGTSYSTSGGFTFWEDSYIALQNGLNKALPDTNNIIVSFSKDERQYILLATSDTEPGTYFFGDRDKKVLLPIAHKYEDLTPELLAEKKSYSYKSRDGLDIRAYLTLPTDYETEKQIPAIIFPHGGPISHDDGGFDYWTQFFANRGYAVLQMNFRGSSGYGYDFMKSGLQSWGLEMQNDVEDGTRWLIEQGVADPEHICMVGASYGGYAALMEAARNSDLYQCAISFAGVTDVAAFVKSRRNYTSYELAKEQIGSDYRELRSRSPIYLVEEIDIPVLLVHGTKDRSVRVAHSQKMHSALKKEDKDVTYIEQKDGDHHLSNETHRIQLFTVMDEFLNTHLSSTEPAI